MPDDLSVLRLLVNVRAGERRSGLPAHLVAIHQLVVVAVCVTELGLITPPIGLNIFVVRGTLPDVLVLASAACERVLCRASGGAAGAVPQATASAPPRTDAVKAAELSQ